MSLGNDDYVLLYHYFILCTTNFFSAIDISYNTIALNLIHPWLTSGTGGNGMDAGRWHGSRDERRKFIEQMQIICIVSMEISTNRREKIGSIRSAPCAIS
jgi:hypothetical protein